ncbi:DNA alkylation repair protein [Brevibacillus panacihumi]|uniref:DNA alkylation repair protein n=1 Tax=Brevibacillus panacihumi TaxID=497735 RepID=UPI003D1E9E2E
MTVALKEYFGTELAQRLSALIRSHDPAFPEKAFIEAVASQVGPLELKGRVAVIAEALHEALPPDYTEAVRILLQILGPENETEEGMFTNGYFLMPIAYYVEKYGLAHFELSMHALYEITKRHTAEYAIRPYLALHVDDCLKQLHVWVRDANPHVRRLVSEGTRPRLPWAKRMEVIKGDPKQNLALLEPLLDDPSFYVRKSVANHLNDLTKDYKEVTFDWMLQRVDHGGEHLPWIIRRALRSLMKSGDDAAWELAGKLAGKLG